MSKRFRVLIGPGAERDVREIRDYIACDKPGAATKWYREIRRHMLSLRRMPFRYEVIPEAEDIHHDYRKATQNSRHELRGRSRT